MKSTLNKILKNNVWGGVSSNTIALLEYKKHKD